MDRLESAEQTLQVERKTLELARAKLDVLEKYTREKTTKALRSESRPWPLAERSLNDDCRHCSLDPKQPESQAPLLVSFDEGCEGIDLGAKPRMTRQGAFSST